MALQIKKRYGLICVVGDREDGKTTWAARHMKMELNLPKEERVYTQGYSNLHYKDSPEIMFTNYAGIRCLDTGTEEGVPTALVHLDQIHKYCDARRAGSRENIEFCDSLIESRQHGFDLLGTTWAMTSIDPRLRKFVKLWVSASQQADGFHYDYFDSDANMIITPPGGLVLPFTRAKSVWPFFRTKELVRDDTLTKISHAKRDQRDELAKKLAVYKKCV